MADETQLLYLEPDDEITTVVRRLREADAPRVVLVASGRTKATTSAVALRLLAQVADEENREVALVADAAARAIAAEAGIPAFASVADANADGAVPLEPPPAQRAPIHVVRGEAEPAAPELASAELAAAPVVASGMEETQAVAVPRPARYPVPAAPAAEARRARRVAAATPSRRARWVLAVAALLLLAGAGVALGTVLPAATVTIRPRAVAVGPLSYNVRPEVHPAAAEPLTATHQGEATGHRTQRTAATGQVLFINYAPDDVFVPAGTVVSADRRILFETTEAVTVPDSGFFFPGTTNAPIRAQEKGPEGNVEALAIDRIEDRDVDRALRAGGNERRVRNDEATGGGAEQELVVVRQSDIDAVTDAIRDDLRQQLADQRADGGEDRIYPTQDPPEVQIEIPDDLKGHVSAEPFTFELTGTLRDDRPYVLRSDAVAAAAAAIGQDETAAKPGTAIDPETVDVKIGQASLDGDEVVVQADVTAEAMPQYDASTIPQRIAGTTAEQAEAELKSIGPTTVSLWPFWVDRVPSLDWRVKVDIQAVERPGE